MTSGATSPAPRIALIHALEESIAPIRAAFQEYWPDSFTLDLLDTSLAPDRAHSGELDDSVKGRFATLGDYAAATSRVAGVDPRAALHLLGLRAGDRPRQEPPDHPPVLRPNEAAFELALGTGEDIGLVVSFPPSEGSLRAELEDVARAVGRTVRVRTAVALATVTMLASPDIVHAARYELISRSQGHRLTEPSIGAMETLTRNPSAFWAGTWVE